MYKKRILGIDPGNIQTGVVIWDTEKVLYREKLENNILLNLIYDKPTGFDIAVIEKIRSYGMSVGQTTFDTCEWIGRFVEALLRSKKEVVNVGRKECIIWHCKSNKAKDNNLRQVLIDKYGPVNTTKFETGKKGGEKKIIVPGPLYGMAGDMWSALGLCTWYYETKLK
jgi:hypothetical protein